ncbi:MAG: calcium/sodium antiporter [Imperialibacter sp.]|uniref:calcium/sodium antiporter n=1 Tax=Imperialibacter sp. TaxID=2038411 RepID=UPI0032EF872B
MLTYLLFVLGFPALIKGADLLVEGASSLAKRFNISDFIIGLTIVSFGTSMPELIVNIFASLDGNADIAVGNIIGSNISNILLILGISSIISPLPIQRNTVLSEIPFSLTATLLVAYLANAALFGDPGTLSISRWDGLILLVFFALFMAYIFKIAGENKEQEIQNTEHVEIMLLPKSVLYIGIGILGLFLGGKWVVDGAVAMAEYFGMSQTFIGLTIVAIGTSLPELVTSAMAAYKGNTDIAVGNVVGSNIFNLLWILGISAFIKPLQFSLVNNADILVLIVASALMILSLTTGRRNAIDRVNGIVFVLLYVGYIVYLVYRG